jgi:hypothetical protein
MFGFVSDHGPESHPFRGKLRFEPLWGPPVGSVTPLGAGEGENGIQLAPLTAPQSRAKSRPLYLKGLPYGSNELRSASYSDPISRNGAGPFPDPELRGRKFYWKQRYDAAPLWEFHKTDRKSGYAENQLPAPILPLPAGKAFTTRIHFENLSDQELGALLFALLGSAPKAVEDKPDTWHSDQHRIHLGKGKPRGLGVCSVEASIRWFNPKDAYASLTAESPGRKPATQAEIDGLHNAFADWCEKKAGVAPGTFTNLDHILDFNKLHTWPTAPSVRYYPPQFKQYSWTPKDNQNPGDPDLKDRPVAMNTARKLAP